MSACCNRSVAPSTTHSAGTTLGWSAWRGCSRVWRGGWPPGGLIGSNVYPLVSDARAGAIAPLDAVLVDVPCTGTGTFRRHPDARWRLTPNDIAVLAATQRSILHAAAATVAPGGLLVYSTCSLETEENDAQVETFLAGHPEFTLEPPPEGTVPTTVLDAGRLRVTPQRHGTDGAFAARMRRSAN